ncbi:TetR family transcriptional regulator [Rhodococcus ruber Chol-4]|nr:TetR family transcriptional regulator [Rhodococcus ruber]KXF84819.1 TetR family transcriptional regulator [Rhodococcus ruber Chol-4]
MVESAGAPGRRDRNMRDKQSRIFAAASSLFAEKGFAGVTTQQISERADVAAGTLFRYATSKGELLMMVYNQQFRAALSIGERESRSRRDPVDAVLALVRPILEAADSNVENTVNYQRELLFGSASEKYRSEGLDLVALFEETVACRLVEAARNRGLDERQAEDRARHAGRSIFAILHLILARAFTGAHPHNDPEADLHAQIDQIVTGFFAALDDDRPARGTPQPGTSSPQRKKES